MPTALPAFPPLLTSPIATTPPLAADVATPPFPAEAISVSCMMTSPPVSPLLGVSHAHPTASARVRLWLAPPAWHPMAPTHHRQQDGDVWGARACSRADCGMTWPNEARVSCGRS